MKGLAISGLLPAVVVGTLVLQPSAKAEDALELELLNDVEAVQNRELDASRGGDAVVLKLNSSQLEAQSYGNQALNTVTGANAIGGSAFGGASGLSSVVQNSGNNVIIQDSTVINIELHGVR